MQNDKEDLWEEIDEVFENGSRYKVRSQLRKKKYLRSFSFTLVLAVSLFLVISSLSNESENAEELQQKQVPNKELKSEEVESVVGYEPNKDDEEDGVSAIPEQPVNSETKVHKVKKGDTLYDLSIQYYGTPQYQRLLAKYNNLTASNSLKVGQDIDIPFPPSDEEYDENVQEVAGNVEYHEVKEGDTLYNISKLYFNTGKYSKFIAEYNKMEDPSDLKVGEKIVIPRKNEME